MNGSVLPSAVALPILGRTDEVRSGSTELSRESSQWRGTLTSVYGINCVESRCGVQSFPQSICHLRQMILRIF
jgi:hypothetical protein